MRRYSTFLPSLLLTAMGLEGCATTSEPPMSGIALPTLSFDPEIALTALASGRLVARDGCLRLVGRAGKTRALVIWPKGSRIVTEGRGAGVILGNSGQRVPIGPRIQLGGGVGESIPPEALSTPLPSQCAGPYFSAN